MMVLETNFFLKSLLSAANLPLQLPECTTKRRFPLLEHLHAFPQFPDLQFRFQSEKRPCHILLRHFLPPKQSITFRNARLIFLSQPFDLGIEFIKLFLHGFVFSQCFVGNKDLVTGINIFPVYFIADDLLIKFPELDKQGSCQIF